MEYMSVKEAATVWGVSQRYAQRCCTEGRIEGAMKISGIWAIPVDAEKPSDAKKAPTTKVKNENEEHNVKTNSEQKASKSSAPIIESNGAENLRTIMPLMNTPYTLGHAFEAANEITDKDERNIALGEYYYFSGQSAKASDIVEEYLTHSDIAIRLSACLLYAYSNLALNRIPRARQAMAQILTTAKSADALTPPPIQILRRMYCDSGGNTFAFAYSKRCCTDKKCFKYTSDGYKAFCTLH